MRTRPLPLLLCATGIAFVQSTNSTGVQDAKPSENLNIQSGPPMLGIHWARGFEPNARFANEAKTAGPRRNPNMSYHGGKIMPTAVTEAIFWGTSWASYSGDKITGMDTWYIGFERSNYAATSDEYTGTNGQVGSGTTHMGHIIDTSAILAEVCRNIHSPDPSGNGYYAVYTDTPRGNAGYCA